MNYATEELETLTEDELYDLYSDLRIAGMQGEFCRDKYNAVFAEICRRLTLRSKNNGSNLPSNR